MSAPIILVYEKTGEGMGRVWAVEGDAREAQKIQEITGLPTILTALVSFDTFLSQQGKHNPFASEA